MKNDDLAEVTQLVSGRIGSGTQGTRLPRVLSGPSAGLTITSGPIGVGGGGCCSELAARERLPVTTVQCPPLEGAGQCLLHPACSDLGLCWPGEEVEEGGGGTPQPIALSTPIYTVGLN